MSQTDEPDKIFVPGFGMMTPGVCTPSWCARSHGGKCMRGCAIEAERKRAERKAERKAARRAAD